MLSSLRTEVRNQLLEEVKTEGEIRLSSSERRDYEAQYLASYDMPRNVWKVLLRHYQARYYRVLEFGGSRSAVDNREYRFTRDLAYALVEAGRVDIVSGGGPGLMRAALEGVHLFRKKATLEGRIIKARALGITIITLPNGEVHCEFLDKESPHREFTTRLQEFMDISHAAYVAPGGIGTNLELALLLQLKQAGHLEKEYPVMVHPAWEDIIKIQKKTWYTRPTLEGTTPFIDKGDLGCLILTDSIPQIVDIVLPNRARWRESINRHVIIVP